MNETNAELINNHALLLAAICQRRARWEPFPSCDSAGEICIDGLRHCTYLDEFGCPAMTIGIEAAIVKSFREKPMRTS